MLDLGNYYTEKLRRYTGIETAFLHIIIKTYKFEISSVYFQRCFLWLKLKTLQLKLQSFQHSKHTNH